MKEKSDLLTAGRLQLKNLEDRDKDSFLQMVTDDRIKKTYMLPDFIDQTAADAFFRRMKALCEENTHFVYGIYLDGRLIGMINACGKQGTTIELGYFISADHWNQGFATEALGTAIRELFRMGYTGITAGYFEGNHASRRVMEKCGMRPLKTETEVVYRGVSRRCLYLGTETAGQEEPGRERKEHAMIQFGMPTLIEYRSLEDNAGLCAELGLRFIELNMNFPEYQADGLDRTDRFLRAAEQAHIHYTIHLDENLDIADFNPLISKAYLETVRRTIGSAKKLLCLRDRYGCAGQPLVLNMHMNHGVHISLPDRKVQMYERDFDFYRKSFTAFRTLCEEWIGDDDIMIAIENTDGFREYEKSVIRYLLESPRFGLTWDIGHSKAMRETDLPFILEHRQRLIHFHIHDGTEEPPQNHLALGDGGIDLKSRLDLAADRNARCVLETKTAAALRRSVEWLRTHGEMEHPPGQCLEDERPENRLAER